MNRNSLSLLLAAPLLTIATACSTDSVAPDLAEFRRSSATAPVLQQYLVPQTIRDHYVALSRAHAGFTGTFVDEDGAFTIIATRRLSSNSDRAIVQWAADYTRAIPVSTIPKYKFVRYDYQTLDNYYRSILSRLPSTLSVSSTGIDEVEGLIRVRLADIREEAIVRKAISDLGIPAGVLVVEEQDFVTTAQSLHSVRRPLIGGLAIQTGAMAAGDYCSIGFIAYQNTNGYPDPSLGKYFTTASHCDNPGPMAGASVAQPTNSPTNLVGYEVDDAPIFLDCPNPGNYCQYADVMVVQVSASVTAAFGNVAKTWVSNQAFPFPIQGTYNIQSIPEGAIVGMWVRKVGASSGETWGQVKASCENHASSGNPSHFIICSQRGSADFKAKAGDSGAPVFQHAQEGNGPLTVGTLWGVFSSGLYNGQVVWSPMSQIGAALGWKYTFH